MTSQKTFRPPSSLLGVPSNQPWAAYSLDSAVTRWGMFVESRLSERDDQHKPKWTPGQLLMEPKKTVSDIAVNGDVMAQWLDQQGGSF